ncbi:3-dehydroquinate synthase [Fenollaria sporofastidiosus]|uniref:3-dehydroquinate synthase n=1 Tax=Fenollaria sporofastidiosus TaxID=2811778 RepID=UPI001BFFDBAE|nr:3-dehydroquinate synthase family protein [Fenollaria sporofastidiosus]
MTKEELSYEIKIIRKASEIDVEGFTHYLVLTDRNLYREQRALIDELVKRYSAYLYVIDAGEESKSFSNLEKLLEYACDKLDRYSLIINVGGGVVTDLGGFAASILYRGIKHINLATSLLAMTDASIGSKTGIDFCDKKNIVGTFYDPYKVYIAIDTLKTLPKEEYISGLAEVIKHALIYESGLYEMLINERDIEDVLEKSIATKVHFVCEDRNEKGARMALNFGHTFGHVIEAMSNYTYSHGQCVAIGMKIALELGRVLGITDEETYKRSFELIHRYYPLEEINYEIKSLKSDKKILGDEINFVFLKGHNAIVKRMNERKVVELYNEHIKNKKF